MSLEALFAPRAVAVLGVSRNPAKLGFRLLQNVLERGYAGRVYPVNPSGEPILSLPSVDRVEALPDGVDLALVSLPAPAVPAAITALAARGVRAAVVLSSGFGEVDDAGRRAQAGMLAAARAAGMRLVGPNCMGVYSAPAQLNGTYFWDLLRVDGGIGVVSQSGAYGGLIFRHLGSRALGVARFVSIGNQADVDVADVLEYLADDEATTLVACFVEALGDGRRFIEVARRATARKPVVVLKGGRSDAGRRAAGSHTGSLAGTYEVYRAAFDRAGIVLAEETEEFFDAIEALTVAGDRRPAAARVAVITVSGGPSVVAADTAERIRLEVPALGDDARARLRTLLPAFAAVGNPVDLTPQVEPERIAEAARVVFDAPEIAGVIAVNVGLDIPEFAEGVVAAAAATGKPTVAFTADAPKITARFTAGRIPVLPSPERAVRAWRALWSARPRPRAAATPVTLPRDVQAAVERAEGALPYAVARRVLEAVGVRFCAEATASTAAEAVAAADRLGYPVVVKADATGLLHKTEAGAVRADLRTPDAVRAACDDMRARLPVERFVVQEQVGPGVEVLIGARRDATFGPVVAAGTGGILAEVLRDVSLRMAPVTADEAREMLAEGARARLLAGPRGLSRDDDGALVRALVGVGDLMLAMPGIVEIDLNPMIVWRGSATAVDAVVIVERGAPP
ncbi:MAG: acetate--CoA ligase family protein [Candidatus Rokubacteria bacterium]|nr:acetate--CoA ligase family protein [Candidatus Rokubacteria bacterium]